jgi:Tfp pilus assembly protein PilO
VTKVRQYQLLIVATIVAFAYLLGSEVVDRWGSALQLYDELIEKEQTSVDPAELAARKVILLDRKGALTRQLAARSQEFEQTQAGLVRFLNAKARAGGFRFESLVPKEVRSAGRMKEVGLTIDFQAGYHQVGAFVHALETGPFPLEIHRADLIARQPGSAALQVRLEGRVALPRAAQP